MQQAIRDDRNVDKSSNKILLLGSQNSGKLECKQMFEDVRDEGVADKDMFDVTRSIRDCVILQMKKVIEQAREFRYELDAEIEANAVYITDLQSNSNLTQQVGRAMQTLWKDSKIKEAFDKRTNLTILDSANYFFNEIERIAEPDYIPNKRV